MFYPIGGAGNEEGIWGMRGRKTVNRGGGGGGGTERKEVGGGEGGGETGWTERKR